MTTANKKNQKQKNCLLLLLETVCYRLYLPVAPPALLNTHLEWNARTDKTFFFVVIAEHAGMLTYLLRPVEYMMCTDRFQYDSFHLLIPDHFSSIKTTLLAILSLLCNVQL